MIGKYSIDGGREDYVGTIWEGVIMANQMARKVVSLEKNPNMKWRASRPGQSLKPHTSRHT